MLKNNSRKQLKKYVGLQSKVKSLNEICDVICSDFSMVKYFRLYINKSKDYKSVVDNFLNDRSIKAYRNKLFNSISTFDFLASIQEKYQNGIQFQVEGFSLHKSYYEDIMKIKKIMYYMIEEKVLTNDFIKYSKTILDWLKDIEFTGYSGLTKGELNDVTQEKAYYKKLDKVGFIDLIKKEYPSKYLKIIDTLGRSKQYGVIISNQTTYYCFCNVIGLIDYLESKKFMSHEIAEFITSISSFESVNALRNFKEYHTHRLSPNSQKKYAMTKRNIDKVQEILDSFN